ncbi:MAG: hypothetical protein R2844_08250 [Caldilineales bacterium]
MNLEDLDVLDQLFDVVVVNRCAVLRRSAGLCPNGEKQGQISPGGLLALTGLAFIGDPSQRQAGLGTLRRQYQDHGFDFFKPMKGYLDFDDKARLAGAGFSMRPYRQLLAANVRSLLSPAAPRYFYAGFGDHLPAAASLPPMAHPHQAHGSRAPAPPGEIHGCAGA